MPKLFSRDGLAKLLLSVLGGATLAILLNPWRHPLAASSGWKAMGKVLEPLRRICFRFGDLVDKADRILRQWAAAGISLLMLGLALAVLMFAAN